MAPPDTYTAKVAQVVRAANEAHGRTPIMLATLTGLSRETLKRRMSGGSPFTTYEIEIIAPHLGMTPTQIFTAADAA